MRTRILTRSGIALAVLTATAAGSSPARAGLDDDSQLIMNKLSQKCLTATRGGDSTVTQWGCASGDDHQRWRFLGDGNEFKIANKATGRCLTVFGEENAQLVHASPCDGDGLNVWRKQEKGGQWVELRPAATDKCLDLHADSHADGAVIQQWGCNWGDNANQTWLLL